jgi:Protein of unknown function (DUF3072)
VPKPLERPPEEWKSAGEPMTESQASFLKRLSADAGEEFDATLSKAAASRRIDELLNRGKTRSAGAPTKRTRKAAASRPAKTATSGGMSEAQSAYLQELAEEEGGEFDPDLTKEEGARRIGELLIKQMARRSSTEPPF